jgi:tryptophan 2,3-dioxygenase
LHWFGENPILKVDRICGFVEGNGGFDGRDLVFGLERVLFERFDE